MSTLLSKLAISGRIAHLFASPIRETGLEKEERETLTLGFDGIAGDCHGGLTRASDSRMLKQFPRGTEVKNARQVSILSEEELADIAARMGIPAIRPEWVGANLVTSGIPDLTLLPPSSRLIFPSGAVIVIDIENAPCRYPADIIAKAHPEAAPGFVAAARNKRGVVGWVERGGALNRGDAIVIWCPPQRIYSHGA